MAFVLRRGSKKATEPKPMARSDGYSGQEIAHSALVAGKRICFGLTWRLISESAGEGSVALGLADALRAGYAYQVVESSQQLLGITRGLDNSKGVTYSAAMLLAENLSIGSVEAFIFKLDVDFYGFVGLVNSRPVPGFDQKTSTLEDAIRLLDEFRIIHAGQNIRVVGNLGEEMPEAETAKLGQTVEHVPATASLRRLRQPARKLFVGAGVGVVLLIVAIASTYWYLAEQERKRIEAERAAREADPNYIYEKTIVAALQSAGVPGDEYLDGWRQIIEKLPLSASGWALTKVECQRIGCKGSWKRYYGSFSEFDDNLPPGAIGLPKLSLEGGVVLAVIQSNHPLDGEKPAAAATQASKSGKLELKREALPYMRSALSQWGSELQDRSLLLNGNTSPPQITMPELFAGPNGSADAGPIQKPVVVGKWAITDEVWTLPSAHMYGFVIPEALTVNFGTSGVNYTLAGKYYAKGKEY